MNDAEADALVHIPFPNMTLPKELRTEPHSTNPSERLNGEIKRRTEVVGVRRLAPQR